MGWTVRVVDDDGCELISEKPHTVSGSNVPVNGTRELHLTVTTNYADLLKEAFGGVSFVAALHDKPLTATIDTIMQALRRMDMAHAGPHDPTFYTFDYEEPEKRFDTTEPYWTRAPESYFEATPGNVRRCLLSLIMLASAANMEGRWIISA